MFPPTVPIRSVRIFFPRMTFPPVGGSPQVVFEQAQSLAQLGVDVELVTWDCEALSHNAGPHTQVKITHLGSFSEKESSFRRLNRVFRSFVSGLSSPEIYYYSPRFLSEVKSRFQAKPVDLAIYHYSFAYAWLRSLGSLREKSRVVVFHNLESELFLERAAAAGPLFPIKWAHQLNAGKLKKNEGSLASLTDELWMISPEDLQRFKTRTRIDGLRLVQPSFSLDLAEKRKRNFQKHLSSNNNHKKMVLGFIGALDYGPNYASAMWIIEKLAPLLAERGFEGEIQIAGAGASTALLEAAHEFPFIKMMGFLPSIEEFWSNLSFSLVPHFAGSGVRMKLLESLVSGVPALATQGATQRIHSALHESPLLFTSDKPEDWVKQIMSGRPYELRKKLQESYLEGISPVVDGQKIYRFLVADR